MFTATQSIRDIAAGHASAVRVFDRFQIDLCSQAEQSLEGACAELQLSVDQLLEKLEEAEAQESGAPAADPAGCSLESLIQRIVRVHHQHVRRELPRLVEMSRKVAAKRGHRAPELHQVSDQLELLLADMLAHLQKEEQMLFPYIAHMDQGVLPMEACFRSVSHPVFLMMQEHEAGNSILTEISRLTDGFQPPPWACLTHRAFFDGLRAFQQELRQHIHLEDDLLFPRAIEKEAELGRGRE